MGAPMGNRNAAGSRGGKRSKRISKMTLAKMSHATPFKNPRLYRKYIKYQQKRRGSSRIA